MAGTVVASRTDTNLVVASEWSEPAAWLGLEWGMPLSAPARFQEDPRSGDYSVTQADITEFVNKAYLRLFCGSDEPFVEYPLSSVDVQRSELRVYQQIIFREPLNYGPSDRKRLWLEIDWPATGSNPPTFGQHPTALKPGVLVVTFKLLEQLPPVRREESPVVEPSQISEMAKMVQVIQEQSRQIASMYSATVGTTISSSSAAAQPNQLNQPNQTSGTTASTDTESLVDAVRFRSIEANPEPGEATQRGGLK